MKDGALTKECTRFLLKSTRYKDSAKVLLADYGRNITKSLAEMGEDERQTLFWGWSSPLRAAGKQINWPGIIAAFLQNYRHYSAPSAESLYALRKRSVRSVKGHS